MLNIICNLTHGSAVVTGNNAAVELSPGDMLLYDYVSAYFVLRTDLNGDLLLDRPFAGATQNNATLTLVQLSLTPAALADKLSETHQAYIGLYQQLGRYITDSGSIDFNIGGETYTHKTLTQHQADQDQLLTHSSQQIGDKLSEVESRVAAKEQLFEQWLDTRHVGFCLVDNLLDLRDDYIALQPRFSSLAEAEAFTFDSADDYAPEGCFIDLANKIPPRANWWSEPYTTQFTGRASAYACIAVGNQPHPTPKPVNRIAVLNNHIGAHHRWLLTPRPTPNYAEPRVFMGHSRNANLEIKGQSYSVSHYDDLLSLAEHEAHTLSIGFSHARIINLGPHPIYIKGFWIVYHGHQKET